MDFAIIGLWVEILAAAIAIFAWRPKPGDNSPNDQAADFSGLDSHAGHDGMDEDDGHH